MNTAASGNNAAAIQSLDDRVTAKLDAGAGNRPPDHGGSAHRGRSGGRARKQHRSAAELADHGSLQQGRPVGLRRAGGRGGHEEQSGRCGPEAVQLQHHGGHATLATVAANYGLKTAVDQHSLDIAARITPLEVDTKVANALLGVVNGAALASKLASQDASISGLQASKADASTLTAYALLSEVDSKIAAALLGAVTTAALKADASALASLLSTVAGLDTPLEVDTKIANALLGLAAKAFVAAQLASRDTSITALQGAKADATLLASYATNAQRAPERPRRSPRGARRPAAFRQRRSC